jgi:PGF-pre-PGF domain-containing protein
MALAFLLAVPVGAAASGDNGSAPAIPDPLATTGNGNSTIPVTLAVPGIHEAAAPSPAFMSVGPLAGGTWSLYTPGQKIGLAATGTGEVLLAGTNGSFTLQLAGIGRPDDFRVAEPGKPRASASRIDILRPGYTEWYAGSSADIEQGMTVEARPPGNGTLIVNYSLAGDLRPVLADRTLVFSDAAGPVMNYGGLAAHDAAGRELPAMLSLAPGTITWQIDDSNAVYPVVIDPWIATQDAVLTAKDAAAKARFGSSVGIVGNTAIVGAFGASVGTKTSAGQAYVFTKSGGSWSQTGVLSATDAAKNAYFGTSLAVSGDGNTAVIGAPGAAVSAKASAGQAYIFKNSAGTWSQSAVLDATDAAAGDKFGSTAAISEDGNTVLLGAVGYASGSGKAYIFKNSGGTWSQAAVLTDATSGGSMFGNAVAISGDGTLAVIGTPSDDTTGHVSVFAESSGSWSPAVSPADTDSNDYSFGTSVGISDDKSTLFIGAYNDTLAGKEYVFKNSAGTWSQAAVLEPADLSPNDNFGNSVAVSGDTAIIGAYEFNSYAGRAYVFKNSGSSWDQAVVLEPKDSATGAAFGKAVSLLGNTALIGANQFNSNTGQAYIFTVSSSSSGPAVAGISPVSGLNTTEKTVTVSGANFDTSASPVVKFTRTGSPNVTLGVVSDTGTALVRKVPAGIEAGAWNVTVVNSDGAEGTNASVTYTALAPPRLAGISPAYGGNATAVPVTVTGSQFGTAAAPVVNLTRSGYGNIPLTGTNLSSTSFTVSVPQDIRAGIWSVTVINPDGLEGTNASVTYTALAPPRLTGISPANGANATATLVTITGALFNGTAGSPVVNLSASGYSNITMTATNLTATSFTVSVPNHNIAAVWNVTVINPDGLEGTNASVVFTTTDPPPVADFTFDTGVGLTPLTVTFTDQSINEPTSWYWDFGDGDTTNATLQNPVHTYATPGVYSVTLNATNALGTGTKTVRKGIEALSLAHENAIVNAGSDAVAYSNFGTSVALSGDGNTAIVGAENITLGVTPAGKAYVFTRSGGTWSRSAVLVPAESANSDAFGDSVALSSDGNTALVGAYHTDVDGNTQAGQAYVFTRNGGSWTESAVLNESSEAEKMAYFGNSVVLSDDGSTALVGAYMATVGTNSSAGKVYVFQKSGGAWSEKTALTASDAEPGAHFGSSVALSRDGTAVVIGAESAGGNSAGRAYVFTGSSTAWSQAAVLAASDGQNGDKFGYSSAVSKNGDTLLVAAPWALVGGDYGGKAYVFTRSGSAWSQASIISTPENAGISDDLGSSLALSDDGTTALISDIGKSAGSLQTAGQVYVIRYDGEGWYKNQILKASDATGYDGFGWSIALRGTNALIGAAWATAGTTADAGQAYVFSVTTPAPAPVVTGISPSSVANATAMQVTITGTAFNTTGVPSVKLTHAGWSDVPLTAVSGTGTSLVRTVPAHIAAGTWNIVVTNPDGQAGTNSSVTFRVAPTVAASFTGTPLYGDAPLVVGFTDTSTGSASSWSWDFGDGSTSSEENPSHTYTRAGVYTVSLTAGNGLSTDTKSVPGYITITSAAEPVIANFAAAPRTGTAPLTVSFTDQSRGGPVNWSWSFGDGGTSTEQNPVHTYTRTGSFSVALTAVNGSYSNTTTQGNYIKVTAVPVTTVTTSPVTTTTTIPVTTTPAAASGSVGADTSGDYGRSASYIATSPGAGAGGTMTFAVNEPLSTGSTGYSYAISSVSIVPSETLGSTDILVTDGGSTSNAPEGRALAGVVVISPVGVNPSAIRSGTIAFAVPSAWLSAHSLAPADIVMLRYHDGAWAELPTLYQDEAGGACSFVATTPGFSYFAIANRAGTAAANPAVTGTASPALTGGAVQAVTTPASLPASGNTVSPGLSVPVTTGTAAVPAGTTGSPGFPALWILAGIGGIAILAAGAVLVRRWWIRRQNPALFQEYD